MKIRDDVKQWQANASTFLRTRPQCTNVAIYAGRRFSPAELKWLEAGFGKCARVCNALMGYVKIETGE